MIDKPLLGAVIALLILSLIMSYSLPVYKLLHLEDGHFRYDAFYFFTKQAIAVGAGFVVMIILSKLDPDRWFVFLGLTIFLISSLLMVAMYFMPHSLVSEIGGAKRWIRLGPVSLAPVEFFKVGFVFFLSWSFSRKLLNKVTTDLKEEFKLFLPYIGVFVFAVLLIAVLQKDFGQVVVLGAILLILFLFIGSSLKFFFTMILVVLAGGVALIRYAPHRMARLRDWWVTVQDDFLSLFPIEQIQHLRVETHVKEPWQISNSLNAIHNGGFFGQGLGNSQFKLGYLPEVHTDFVLSGIAEELGFFGVALVVLATLVIIFRIFKIASKVESPMYYLFSIGIGLLIAFAFLLNAYGISGIFPIKGIAVPFLSYGGSHILAMCVAIGMVLMISKKVPRGPDGRIL